MHSCQAASSWEKAPALQLQAGINSKLADQGRQQHMLQVAYGWGHGGVCLTPQLQAFIMDGTPNILDAGITEASFADENIDAVNLKRSLPGHQRLQKRADISICPAPPNGASPTVEGAPSLVFERLACNLVKVQHILNPLFVPGLVVLHV